MLLAFRVTNHKSFRDEAELSLVRSARMASRTEASSLRADLPSPVAAIYGANASGKSNLLDALEFMAQAVRDSYGRWPNDGPIPLTPFALDETYADGPSTYEVELLLDGVRYQYGLALDRERVLEEWLYAYPRRRRQIWFERDAEAKQEFRFGTLLGGQKQILAELTRPNALFLSVASSTGHDQLEAVAAWFDQRVHVVRPRGEGQRLNQALEAIAGDATTCQAVLSLLRQADLGVTRIRVAEPVVQPGTFPEEYADKLEPWTNLFVLELDPPRGSLAQHYYLASTDRIRLEHAAGRNPSVTLPFNNESRGTRALIGLAVPTLQALKMGGTLLIDELDTSLHPNLVREIVRLFQSPGVNRQHAQLVFTSHDTSLLGNLAGDEPLLKRDQVWLTEKDDEGATHLYPLTDFNPRKNENLERGYLQGRYGAVPFFRWDELETLLAAEQ